MKVPVFVNHTAVKAREELCQANRVLKHRLQAVQQEEEADGEQEQVMEDDDD